MRANYAEVVVGRAIDHSLTYAIPEELLEKIAVGSSVRVPLRGKTLNGVVVGLATETTYEKVLPLIDLIQETPLLTDDLIELAHWVATYYCAPLWKVMEVMVPGPVRRGMAPKEETWVVPLITGGKLRTLHEVLRLKAPKQAHLVEIFFQREEGLPLKEIEEMRASVNALVKKGVLRLDSVKLDRTADFEEETVTSKAKELNPEQREAFEKIATDLGRFQTHLLYGVTGSGKTEVYFHAIERARRAGKGVLFLVPEVLLTAQTVSLLRSRFQEKIVLFHHRLSEGERRDGWTALREGKAMIALGPRSAVFAPVKDLGLIIVDEEHESAYKQDEEAPYYHARDVAVMRGKNANAVVVLGSATPSFESYTHALQGRYTLSILKERHGKGPRMRMIDMGRGGPALFSPELLDGITARKKRGEQTVLLLNRRGYHTQLFCQTCNQPLFCPHCSFALTFHKKRDELVCHLCNFTQKPPRSCPGCEGEMLRFKGVGTELVERKLKAILPEISVLRIDGETTRLKGSHEELLQQFRSGKADVMIGTQIIAKGLHVPTVTLVGVLQAEGGLHIPDFRAVEKTFQLLIQVAGRAGRSSLGGEVIVQTYTPGTALMKRVQGHDYDAFYREEMVGRELLNLPPLQRLIKLTFLGPHEERTLEEAERFRAALMKTLPSTYELFQVAPSGYAKVNDTFRYQLLIRAQRGGQLKNPFLKEGDSSSVKGGRSAAPEEKLVSSANPPLKGRDRAPSKPFMSFLAKAKELAPLPRQVRLLVDVDPLSTFF